MVQEKNIQKYEAYRSMHEDLKKAMSAGFYFQAIFIEYAILEDRLASVLKYANVPYLTKSGRDVFISEKIKRIENRPELSSSFVKKRLSPELLDSLNNWLSDRNDLIHHLASTPYDSERVRLVAEKGAEICRQIKNKTDSVIRHYKSNRDQDQKQ